MKIDYMVWERKEDWKIFFGHGCELLDEMMKPFLLNNNNNNNFGQLFDCT